MNHLLDQNWNIFVLLKHGAEAVVMVQCSWQVLSNTNRLSTTCYVGRRCTAVVRDCRPLLSCCCDQEPFLPRQLNEHHRPQRQVLSNAIYKTAWLILYWVIKLHGTKSIFIFWLISNLNTSFVCKFYMFGILLSFSELCCFNSQLLEKKSCFYELPKFLFSY